MRKLSLNQRIGTTKEVCLACKYNLGFKGGSRRPDAISMCSGSAGGTSVTEVNLANGMCPNRLFDATNLKNDPVIQSGLTGISGGLCAPVINKQAAGRTLFIVANGPSHREIDLPAISKLPHVDMLMINKFDERIFPTQYWLIVDKPWAVDQIELWRSYAGTLFVGGSVDIRRRGEKRIRLQTGLPTFCKNLDDKFFISSTSVIVAIQLAYSLGYSEVFVVGCDMSRDSKGNMYAWGSNPNMTDTARESRFARENSELEKFARVIPIGFAEQITFVSSYNKWPFLQHFKSLPHETFVENYVAQFSQKSWPKLSLITCTGGRPEAFKLCEKYMSRQQYPGELEWIVVDDCDPATECTMGQTVIRPSHRWSRGMNTQKKNMLIALEAASGDVIATIEDDEWYRSDYLVKTVGSMNPDTDIAGEMFARYYNLKYRCFRAMNNHKWSSACQTVIRRSLLPDWKLRLEKYHEFDIRIWQDARNPMLLPQLGTCVGMKGLPGRAGIGSGHRPANYIGDPELEVLKQWIGSDAEQYRSIYPNNK